VRRCVTMSWWMIVIVAGRGAALSGTGGDQGQSARAEARDDALTPERFEELAKRIAQLAKSQNAQDFNRAGDEISNLSVVTRDADPVQYRIQREQKTRLLLRGLQATHERVDPNYGGPGDTPRVSVIPRGTEASGAVDPKTIKDPVLRRQYEEDLRKNDEKIKRANFQIPLKRERDLWPKRRLYRFVRRNYDMDDREDQEEWKQLIGEELKDKKLILLVMRTFKKLDEEVIVDQGGALIARPPQPAATSKAE